LVIQAKSVKDSAVIVSQLVGPQDVSNYGYVHGGVIMRLIDTTASVVAVRHSRTNAVTVSIDRMDFFFPAYAGELITLKASPNYFGKTPMEIGVRVETENLIKGMIHHTNSAYVTYVVLDKSGRPRGIPPVVFETDDEKRRSREALVRRETRLKLKELERRKII
jgi:uncharacterized protein (TIGR00369 family)